VDFNFTTGQESSDGGFKFQFVWNIVDITTVLPPPDLEKIGKVEMGLDYYEYDPVINEEIRNSIPLKYHSCTPKDRESLGEEFRQTISDQVTP
jgi:hypothetical protein